jgi:succinate-acetate transporter protein
VTFALWLSDPEVPISSMVEVPMVARREALNVMVTLVLPFAGGVTGLAVAVADTPLGNAFALNSTAEWKPFWLVMVSLTEPLPFSSMVREEGETAMVKFAVPPEALTVRAIVVLWVSEPDVPVIVTVAAPVVAAAEAVRVRVEVAVPFAGGVTGLAENVAVTPLGRPVALSVVAELKLFWLVMVMVLVPLAPWVTVTDAGEAAMVKFGAATAFTVRARVVVAVRLPEVPVMVTVEVPVVAVLLAVSESTLVPVVGLVPNVAVTPLGRPDAARVTLPVNPPASFTVMVLVPAAPPCVIDRLLGESESVKLGVAAPARALIKFAPFGLPHPVTMS